MPNGLCAGQKGRYDTLDRLDTASGRFGDRDYDLNRNGNRTQLVADGETTVTTYPKNSSRKRKNQPNSDTFWTYTHDANGSITAKTSTVGAPDLGYEYDAHNRLIRTTSDDGTVTTLGEYAYNGLGQRVSKDAGGEVFEYRYGLGGELLAVLDSAGQPVREFVYLNSQPLAVLDHGADAVYYVHNDHLGTPRAMSDETGTRVWRAVYDPFGAASVDEDPDQDGIPVTLNVRFPGQYFDAETGLHYNYFRYYDPSTGRYVTSDPIGLGGGMNTYGYAYQNPLSYTDPTGETPWGLVFAGADFVYQLYRNGGNLKCVNWTEVGLSALGGGAFNAFKVAKIHRLKSAIGRGNPNSWNATRSWYGKNINRNIPEGRHIHHWLVERRYFEGNRALERIFNQPWNLNPKPFTNLYHNTRIHNSGIAGRLRGTPIWARETAASAMPIAAGDRDCACNAP